MTSDQELFAKGLATYRKVIDANYMAHQQVHNLLHEILLNDAKDGFVFADLACGTAPFSAAALLAPTFLAMSGSTFQSPRWTLQRTHFPLFPFQPNFAVRISSRQLTLGRVRLTWCGSASRFTISARRRNEPS